MELPYASTLVSVVGYHDRSSNGVPTSISHNTYFIVETDDDKTQENRKWIENRKVHEKQSWNVWHKNVRRWQNLAITRTWENSMPGKEGKKTVGYSGRWKVMKWHMIQVLTAESQKWLCFTEVVSWKVYRSTDFWRFWKVNKNNGRIRLVGWRENWSKQTDLKRGWTRDWRCGKPRKATGSSESKRLENKYSWFGIENPRV